MFKWFKKDNRKEQMQEAMKHQEILQQMQNTNKLLYAILQEQKNLNKQIEELRKRR